MKVKVAETAGFCFGVKRAVNKVYELIDTEQKPIFTLGPIIHNEGVVADLEARGVHVIAEADLDSPDDTLQNGTVVIRSHGVGKPIYDKLKEKNISYVDVTCPFVLKIHRIVEKESLAGNHIIIIGDKDHPEVQGICGWCQGPYTVIRNKEEAEAFVPPKGKKISIVSQTTFNYNKFKDLVEILCKKRYDNNVLNILNILNTICNATEERQREAKNIAGEVDTMLVVGGRHSSNTQKLFEICKKECGNTYYIQTPVDLDSEMFQCSSCVGITAGASTPKKIIEEVQEHVRVKFTLRTFASMVSPGLTTSVSTTLESFVYSFFVSMLRKQEYSFLQALYLTHMRKIFPNMQIRRSSLLSQSSTQEDAVSSVTANSFFLLRKLRNRKSFF